MTLSRSTIHAAALGLGLLCSGARGAAPEASTPATAPAAPMAPAVPAAPAAPVAAAPAAAASEGDTTAPIIEDVAAAAGDPATAPVVTIMISDHGSGVADVAVVYRAAPGDWVRVPVHGGTSGLFVCRLPDGLQRSGFEYYVEATDFAGNGPARIGSRERPIAVEAATVSTVTRMESLKDAEAVKPRVDPGLVMLGLGVGVLAGAGTTAFVLDYTSLGHQLDAVAAQLDKPGLSSADRDNLKAAQTKIVNARTLDGVAGAVLGVVAVAGLVTGTVLLVVAATE